VKPEENKVVVQDSKDPSSLTLVCVIKHSSLTYPQALNRVVKARALLTGVFSESDNTAGKHYNIEDDGDEDGIDDPKLIASWLESVHKDANNNEKVVPKLFEPRQQRQTRRAAQEKAKIARKKAKQETLAEKKKTAVLRERGADKADKQDKNEVCIPSKLMLRESLLGPRLGGSTPAGLLCGHLETRPSNAHEGRSQDSQRGQSDHMARLISLRAKRQYTFRAASAKGSSRSRAPRCTRGNDAISYFKMGS